MTRIEELEQKLNECQKALAELKENWKPNNGEEVWYIAYDGYPDNSYWNDNDKMLNDLWNKGLVFANKEECNKFYRANKALAELKESKKEGKWKPTYGDYYWLRDDWGNFRTHEYCAGDCMDWRLKNVPLFPTKEECERYWHFMDTVKEKSYEFSKEEWENEDIPKFVVKRNYEKDYFEVGCFQSIKYFNTTYFKTEEEAKYIIDNFKDELMEYWI